jgi:hypothetical protein
VIKIYIAKIQLLNVNFFIQRPESQGRTAFNKDILENNSNTSSDKIQLSPIGPAAPDKLEVPVTTIWNVYTTCVISTTEVWIRLIDDDYNVNRLYIDCILFFCAS